MRWLCFILLLSVVAPLKAKTITFSAIEGLAEQKIGAMVIAKIYETMGFDVVIHYLPARRAQRNASLGSTAGEVMRIRSYGENLPNLIRVPTSYYSLETMAFSKKQRKILVLNQQDLMKYSVAKVRGVKHTDVITQDLPRVSDVSNTQEMMTLLNRELVDIGLTNTIDGLLNIKSLGLEEVIEPNHYPLTTLKLYHYLHQEYDYLVPIVDETIKKLKASGELTNFIEKAENTVLGNIR